MSLPELRVGQVWMLREQSHRVKITAVSSTHYTIRYLTGIAPETVERSRAWTNGNYYTNSQQQPARDMVTCIYDPVPCA